VEFSRVPLVVRSTQVELISRMRKFVSGTQLLKQVSGFRACKDYTVYKIFKFLGCNLSHLCMISRKFNDAFSVAFDMYI
jgi:hypothetical protein